MKELMKRKILACLCAGAMILSMAACGNSDDLEPASVELSQAESTAAEESKPEDVVQPETVEVSVDFEDGNYDFAKVYLVPGNADASQLSLVDYNGSKALQIKSTQGKVPYVGIDVSGLLGDNVSRLAAIEMTMGIAYEDGSFNSASGEVITWWGEELEEKKYDWSVYREDQNPKVAVVELDSKKLFTAGNDNIMIINLKTDNGLADHGSATLYIDDIRFLDVSGNLITADTTVAFNAPAGFENTDVDMTNLAYLKDAVSLEGFAMSADAWSQAGIDITEDIQNLLVPGAIVEIEYASESGDIWMVITGAENGWIRVNDGDSSVKNLTRNVAQIFYEDIMALCGGSDSSALTGQIQCESDTPWEVFSVKIGQDSGLTELKNTTKLEGFEVSGDAWSQAGVDITEDIRNLLVPGAIVEVEYTSESGDMWLVVTGAENGWIRISDSGRSTQNGKIAQFTYEEIMEACGGADATTLTSQIQCESDTAWEVYRVGIGTATK